LKENIYIQSVKLNGKDWSKPFLPFSELKDGGTIVYTINEPNEQWGIDTSLPVRISPVASRTPDPGKTASRKPKPGGLQSCKIRRPDIPVWQKRQARCLSS
jgi:hypothetical protein